MQTNEQNNVFAVLMFYSKAELGIPYMYPNEKLIAEGYEAIGDYIYRGEFRFDNKFEALEKYANTRCAASQLIEAKGIEYLNLKIRQMKENFSNEEWLKRNIYPYI